MKTTILFKKNQEKYNENHNQTNFEVDHKQKNTKIGGGKVKCIKVKPQMGTIVLYKNRGKCLSRGNHYGTPNERERRGFCKRLRFGNGT